MALKKTQKINQKGIIYSIMIVTMIISILGLNVALRESTNNFYVNETIEASIVKEKESNINRTVISLYKTGYAKDVIERSLPFSYNINNDEISFTKKFPSQSELFDETFDILNLSKVLFEDTSYSNIFDGINSSITVPNNYSWSRTDNTLTTRIDNFCYAYSINEDSFQLEKSSSSACVSPFDASTVKKSIFDIVLNSTTSTYDTITCSPSSLCSLNDTYNSSNSDPYFELNINQTNCPNCNISDTTISAQASYSTPFSITLSCSTVGCTTQSLILTQNNYDFDVSTLEEGVEVTSTTLFNTAISDLRIDGVTTNINIGSITKTKE